MAYLNPLDIDDSYLEYVISELVWWQWYFIVGRGETSQYSTTLSLDFGQNDELTESAQLWKRLKIKVMAYLKDFYPFGYWWFFAEYVISELKYDAIDILLLDVD